MEVDPHLERDRAPARGVHAPRQDPDHPALLLWALLASGLITMRKVDGWQTLARKLADQITDLAARSDSLTRPKTPQQIPTQLAMGPSAISTAFATALRP